MWLNIDKKLKDYVELRIAFHPGTRRIDEPIFLNERLITSPVMSIQTAYVVQ